MKLPNGYGSICKNGKNRRKPYIVRVTTGWNNDGTQIRKVLGYTTSPALGLKMLAEYHNDPYNVDYKNITFEKIWEKVLVDLEKAVKNSEMSQSNLNGLMFAYKNHCQKLHKEKIFDLKYKKMQDVVDEAVNTFNGEPLGVTAKGNIKTVCVKVFNYALYQYELPLKNNPAINLKCGVKGKSDKHIPFSDEEISILWGLQHLDLVKVVLIYCYSGVRPNEIFITSKDNIFLEQNYFVTGSKTEAGKDRLIPIHPKIKHLMKYFNDIDKEYPFSTIFNNFNYLKFEREFNKLMKELRFTHTPYDGRHTFITKMKKAGVNDFILKRIVGHSISDITEKVYTHRDIEELINEVKKIN